MRGKCLVSPLLLDYKKLVIFLLPLCSFHFTFFLFAAYRAPVNLLPFSLATLQK